MGEAQSCPRCAKLVQLTERWGAMGAAWEVLHRLSERNPDWRDTEGACLACVQQALLEIIRTGGEQAVHESIQAAWPLDRGSALGALPTPLRMHADPSYTGKGVTLAMVDSGFYPHPDLFLPHNRIRAWVNASVDPVIEFRYPGDIRPEWTGWDDSRPHFWHGLMTSCAAAGNGWLSQGLYRGLASDSDLVLVQTANANGRIPDHNIRRALSWLAEHAEELGIRVVNLSVCGDETFAGGPIDASIRSLVEANVTVVAAAGNDGQRRLVPPASAPHALTVGGLDDHNTIPRADCEVWHSNFGESCLGLQKPEVVAPSVWVVAPLLPETDEALRATELFAMRRSGDRSVEAEIKERKLVTPEYKLTEGTSFAAPIVASVICCMLEANPTLTPAEIHQLVISSAVPVQGASPERQGAGAVHAGTAVAAAARSVHESHDGFAHFPIITAAGVRFTLRRRGACEVFVRGDWDGWAVPGVPARQIQTSVWVADVPALEPGRYAYTFVVDGLEWRDDVVVVPTLEN